MSGSAPFEKLFQPIRLGEMTVKNRIVVAPMLTCSTTDDGFVTEQTIACYEERARGGAGLVISEETCIDSPLGKTAVKQICVDDDKYIPGLGKVAKAIKQHGARAALQLAHSGRLGLAKVIGGQPVAPSAIAALDKEMPRELSVAEIEGIVEKFAASAERAKKVGFDAIELQACGGLLLIQFLSPESNQRQDAYGGSLENRARIVLDIIAAIKERVGNDYPVWVRLAVQQFHTDAGINLSQSKQITSLLERAGAVAINVSADYYQSAMRAPWKVEGERFARPPMAHPHGFLLPLAAGIKKVASVPVMAIGWLDAEMGERALREGQADMIVMGRTLLADPEMPNKMAAGRLNDVRPCIGCLMCQVDIEKGVKCSVNARAGREADYPPMQAGAVPARKKRVMVIGGGPAGLEAARIAAMRGHSVTLYEKGTKLGGQLLIASQPPHKEVLNKLIDYLAGQIKKLGVKIELGREAIAEAVLKAKPDAVVVATGTKRAVPNIAGIQLPKVSDVLDVLSGKDRTGGNVIVIGAGVTGLEVAEYLAFQDKKVTIVEMLEELGAGMERWHKQYLLERLKILGVPILVKTRVEAIQEKGAVVCAADGEERLIPADSIVLSTGACPNQELYEKLSGKVAEIHLAGDCVQPRRIIEAIYEGFVAGQKI